MHNILTFDLEEWYVYRSLFGDYGSDYRLEHYLDLFLDTFTSHNIQATFFVLGSIARSHPHIIRKIFDAGHEIGCHSDVHTWLTDFNESQFEEDTRKAISSIEDVTGSKVLGYRAPAFSITPKNKWVLEILKKHGIEYDCSIFPAGRDFGGFTEFSVDTPSIIEYAGIKIKEFPMGVTTILGKKIAYSGGGYFRLLPYSTIKKLISSRGYNMTYFHLRDFDKEQSRKLTIRYFKDYYGINSAMAKFHKLIADFIFTNITQANKTIDWSSTHIIKL
jgi:polysaccharide deacetylase family protein (PEP-CTERM system associated)